MAELYTLGLLRLKPNRHQFIRVTQKEFWAGLSLIPCPLRIDTRLSESHDLVNYYAHEDNMEAFRKMGFKTPQLGYIHKGDYVLHETLASSVLFNIPQNVLKFQTIPEIKKSLPELLEMVGCPRIERAIYKFTPGLQFKNPAQQD